MGRSPHFMASGSYGSPLRYASFPRTPCARSFLPRISVAPESLWEWVDRARAEFKSVALKRAVDLFFADDAFRMEFQRTPSSVAGHTPPSEDCCSA